MQKSSCDHIGIFSNNPNRLVAFYEKVLGFRLESSQILDRSIMKSIFGIERKCLMHRLEKDGLKIEIFSNNTIEFKKSTKFSLGYNHWGYSLSDKQAFLNDIKAKVKTKVEILEINRDGRLVYFLKDPDANLIELRD